MKQLLKKLPVIGPALTQAYRSWAERRKPWRGSEAYWVERYAAGGSSGAGSYDQLAEFKAEVLNELVRHRAITRVLELGCGDGNQLQLAKYPSYIGFDVSPSAVERCREIFAGDPSKRFALLSEHAGETAQLALSLDVIYHLIEDEVFEAHMRTLFASAEDLVVIYSSNTDDNPAGQAPHVKHRELTPWIERACPEWTLARHIPNRYPAAQDGSGSQADFFIYEKRSG